jgi:hypothetical protein
MEKLYAAILIALAVITLSSCEKVIGKGPIVTETRTTREFSEIEFSVPGNIRFIEAPETELVIEAQKNIIDVIETYVSGTELRVKVRDNTNIRSHEEINITVRAPAVHTIALKGSGNLDIPGNFDPEYGRLSISGSGNVLVSSVETRELNVSISGSGNVEILNGTTDHEDISISGSGDVNLLGVEANTVKTHTSGSGTTRVFVNDELEVRISGSGDLFYKGSPAVNANISGSGRVVKL